MADVDVLQTVTHESTKKTRKVKKTTKRRESADQGSEITITEIDQTTTEVDGKDEGYVMNSIRSTVFNGLCFFCLFDCFLICDFVLFLAIWQFKVN